MKKSTKKMNDIECPKCHKSQTVKYGKYKNTQKYKCKECGKIFKEKNYVIKTKKEKELVSVLLNLAKIKPIEVEKYFSQEFVLSDLLPKGEFDEKAFKDVSISIENAQTNHASIKCNDPKFLVCLVNNAITIIRLPDYKSRSAKKEKRGITPLTNENAHYKKNKNLYIEDSWN